MSSECFVDTTNSLWIAPLFDVGATSRRASCHEPPVADAFVRVRIAI